MKKIHLYRAFRDQDYYLSLTEEERAALPANPAGNVEIDADDLRAVAGGITASCVDSCRGTAICTPCPPKHCL